MNTEELKDEGLKCTDKIGVLVFPKGTKHTQTNSPKLGRRADVVEVRYFGHSQWTSSDGKRTGVIKDTGAKVELFRNDELLPGENEDNDRWYAIET